MNMTTTDLERLKGQSVIGADGDTIGRVEDVYLDEQTSQPEWLAVTTGLFGSKVTFVPIGEARVEGDAVVVPFAKDQVKDAPNAEADGVLSEEEEARLYDYYGLAYSHAPSDTGLPVGGVTAPATAADDAMTRSEEELVVGTTQREAGKIRLRKWVETEHVSQTVPVAREEVRIEREPITDGNLDQALSGPEISEGEYEVTLHEEQAVAATETVPKERIRLEKDVVMDEETVGADLRKEQIQAEAKPRTV